MIICIWYFSTNSTFNTFSVDYQDIFNETNGVINPTDDTTQIEDELGLILDPTNSTSFIDFKLKSSIAPAMTMNETSE